MWRFSSQVVALNFLIKSGCRRSRCGSFAFIFQSWIYIIPAYNLRLQKLVSLSPSNSNERMSKKGKVTRAKNWVKIHQFQAKKKLHQLFHCQRMDGSV